MKRYQFEVSDERAAKLEQLKKDCDIATDKELFSNAITLLMWAVREVRAGRTIASVDENNSSFREVLLPALENAVYLGGKKTEEISPVN